MHGDKEHDPEEADFSFLQDSEVPDSGTIQFGRTGDTDPYKPVADCDVDMTDTPPAFVAENGGAAATGELQNSPDVSAARPRGDRSARPRRAQQDSSEGSKAAQEAGSAAVTERPRQSNWLLGYAVFVTLLLLYLFLSGKVHLNPNHALESLPDIRPLAPNEFKAIPEDTELPEGHALKLGQTRRFGDIEVTPLRVSRETLSFEDFQTHERIEAAEAADMEPKLKMWIRIRNVSRESSFPPFDADLMSHRYPPYSTDEETLVNSALWVWSAADEKPSRVLNFHHSRNDPLVLSGQNAGKVLAPGQEMETWVASEEIPAALNAQTQLRWRVQIRKGVHPQSLQGVTTLFDCRFAGADINTDAAGSG